MDTENNQTTVQLDHLEVCGHGLYGLRAVGGQWPRIGSWRDRDGRFVAEVDYDDAPRMIEAGSFADLCRLVDAELARFAVD
jgi:hypothetical protein